MNYYVAIVIYNTECQDSITCQTLPDFAQASVIVLDNSTRANQNESYCAGHSWKYISMHGNQGLSRAYNRAIEEIGADDGIVVWMDDDTEICANFFDLLDQAVASNPESCIFLPLVMSDSFILSPSKTSRHRSTAVLSLAEITAANITGVNSGMAVRLRTYKNYRYDEKLFLDYVDHKFLTDIKKSGLSILVVPEIVLRQRFFLTQKNVSWDSVIHRHRIFAKDFIYFCDDTLIGKIYARLYLLYRLLTIYSNKLRKLYN